MIASEYLASGRIPTTTLYQLLWSSLISQIMDSSRNYRTFLLCVINGHREQREGVAEMRRAIWAGF
jgi:hypothetical protein